MCGITGFWSRQGGDRSMQSIAERMAGVLAHRGPDDQGCWVDHAAGVALAHRRLSIVDLSPLGHQPMTSASGRYVITYNGEVYNHATLRRELLASGAPSFRGHSDTEVMLAAIEAFGLVAAVKRFVGMFAFALWDRHDRVLHLVRDRIGIKPLYYGWAGSALVFGSELKSIAAYPAFHGDVDRNALALFMRFGCVPAPNSIYQGVRKLLPGTMLTFASPDESDGRCLTYWSARSVAERGAAAPVSADPREVIDALESLIREAIALRMVADVPLGAFLSGGIDSSTVVALMQTQHDRPVRTFSIGFEDDGYNEAHHAAAVARHLGTDHTELYVSPDDARAVIPKLPTLYDEPFADSSQIPTFIVSELARRHVTIALSGDGGDELFAGYNRHVWTDRIWRASRSLPRSLRAAQARLITAVPPHDWDRLYQLVRPLLPRRSAQATPGSKLHRLAQAFAAPSPDAMYLGFASQWSAPTSVVLGSAEPPTAVTDPAQRADLASAVEQMLYLDLVTYLPDDVLTKLDRASMGVSLEARVPLLDHRVVEFAWSIPLALKIRAGQSKWVLRQILDRHVPRALTDRPKTGFAMPLDDWLRGPLRPWAESLLDRRRLREEGFLDATVVHTHWMTHLSGRKNLSDQLWNVLMFQAWLDARRCDAAPAHSEDHPDVVGAVP